MPFVEWERPLAPKAQVRMSRTSLIFLPDAPIQALDQAEAVKVMWDRDSGRIGLLATQANDDRKSFPIEKSEGKIIVQLKDFFKAMFNDTPTLKGDQVTIEDDMVIVALAVSQNMFNHSTPVPVKQRQVRTPREANPDPKPQGTGRRGRPRKNPLVPAPDDQQQPTLEAAA